MTSLKAAAEKFVRDMEKLNLGVSIKINDGEWHEIAPTPKTEKKP